MASTAILLQSIPSALKPTSRTRPKTVQQQQQQQPQQQQQTPVKAIPPPQPGTWQHPRIHDISRRQGQAAFNSQNVWNALQCAVALILLFILPSITKSLLTKIPPRGQLVVQYSLWILKIIVAANMLYAFRPLFGPKDEIEDIPLTPSQRALLGLKPSSTPLTPISQTATPPRYSRSATPRSSLSDRGSASPSPLDNKRIRRRSGSASDGRGLRDSLRASTSSASGSPYGGNTNPLMQKTLVGNAERRMSFDIAIDSSPSPVMSGGASKASVGLNNKWLYERGKHKTMI